jgi:hypothetical protein
VGKFGAYLQEAAVIHTPWSMLRLSTWSRQAFPNRVLASVQLTLAFLPMPTNDLGNRFYFPFFTSPNQSEVFITSVPKRPTHATTLWSQHYYQRFLDTYLLKNNQPTPHIIYNIMMFLSVYARVILSPGSQKMGLHLPLKSIKKKSSIHCNILHVLTELT